MLEKSGTTKNNAALYRIKFLKSGSIVDYVSSGHIRNAEVKDYYSPSVFGVGYLGTVHKPTVDEKICRHYQTWRQMIRRCYDKTYSKYKWYGAKGVYVCDRWHCLDNFLEDVEKLPGYDYDKLMKNEIELDKDSLSKDVRYYSPETCCFMSHTDNVIEANKRNKKSRSQLQ